MAFKISTSFKGIAVSEAYARVETATVLAGEPTVEVSVHYFSAPGAPSFTSSTHECPYALEGENPFKQAYEHLKTLPEFAGAIDC